MNSVRLTDVTYMHAAPQDCKPAHAPPPMYHAGDVVRVDRAGAASLTVELRIADEGNGHFEGRIVEAPTEELLEVGTEVVFEYR